VAWLLPELDEGAEPEPKPLELEFELELELELELEPVELVPDEVEPEPEPELVEEPVDDEPDDVEEEEAVLCVDPGRVKATMPAAATLAMVTVVVADRTLARPRSLSAMARRTRSRCALLMYPILQSHTRSPSVRTFSVGYEANGLPRRPRPTLPRQHEGHLKLRDGIWPARRPDRPGRRPVRAGSATGDAAPDLPEQHTGPAIRDRDWDQLHLLRSGQEFAQVGLGEEVHRLARLLDHVIRLKFARGQTAGAQRPVLQRVDVEHDPSSGRSRFAAGSTNAAVQLAATAGLSCWPTSPMIMQTASQRESGQVMRNGLVTRGGTVDCGCG
jgi:hypothetical protein